MDWVLAILFFLHVAGAVVAFGPTFSFPFIGNAGGKEPMHVNFALRLQNTIAERLVWPLALLQGVTGLLLVWRVSSVANVSFVSFLTQGWLLLAILLYLVALGTSYFVLLPTLHKLIELTSTPAPPPAPGAPAPSGPPPAVAALVARGKRGGMLNAVLILVIVFLMVTKPF